MTDRELLELAAKACGYCDDGEFPVPLYTSPPAQAAVEPVKSASGAILGARVQGDTVIIKMKGGKRWGNQLARELCHKLLTEQEPGGNPNAFNKWS